MYSQEKAGNISALILAAGYSSRMEKGIKALLPFGEHKNMLVSAIEAFAQAQVFEIFVVVGHEDKKIISAIEEHYQHKNNKINIHFVYNEHYAKGMLSSIQAGFNALLEHKFDASFLLPVDAALVRFSSIIAMKKAYEAEKMNVLIPFYNGKSGHPPLIAKEHFLPIIKYKGNDGLRGYLENCDKKSIDLIDNGIISDIDTEIEYNKSLEFLEFTINRDILSLDECYALMQKENLAENTIRHSVKVALGAFRLAQALDLAEVKTQFALIAGLLHDIQKGKDNHAKAGEQLLTSMAYGKLATAIATHTDMAKEVLDRLGIDELNDGVFAKLIDINCLEDVSCFVACICVYIADRFYIGDKFVTIKERFNKVKIKYKDDFEALKAIENREKQATYIIQWYENKVGQKAMFIVDNSTNPLHKFEKELLQKFKDFV